MATYWLVPLEWNGETAVFGEERFELAPADKRDRFVRALQAVHPRLLLAFKAHLLVADEALDACGTDDLPFGLGSAGPIVLRSLEASTATDEEPFAGWPLSHCAEAYLSGLPSPGEAARLLSLADLEPGTEEWAAALRAWLLRGDRIIMLREDGVDR